MLSNQKGFSLVELAIVLVIIGLLLTVALKAGISQIQSTRIATTKQKQDIIKLALMNFISSNNRLPCPAIAGLAPNTAGYGIEALNKGVCTGTFNADGSVVIGAATGTVVTGIVPWGSLALSDENATDGFYNRFTYQVAVAATNTTSTTNRVAGLNTISGLKGAISIHSGTPTVLGAPIAGNQTNFCVPVGTCSAVLVIVSHGSNGFGAYNANGGQNQLPTGADELENTNKDSKFVIKDFSDNPANPYDDMVFALTASDLLTPLTNHGSIQDYNAIINENISNIKNAIIADAVKNRSGTSGSYSYPIPNSIAALSLPSNTSIDPWGVNYNYNSTIGSIDSGSAPSSTAFSVTSYGPNMADDSGGGDDIQRDITVNQLQEAFAKVGW